jgi:hypothetical protein
MSNGRSARRSGTRFLLTERWYWVSFIVTASEESACAPKRIAACVVHQTFRNMVMAKTTRTSGGKSGGGKERITPPKKPLLTREAKRLPTGDPAAGRIMAEERQAVRQGVRKPKKKP